MIKVLANAAAAAAKKRWAGQRQLEKMGNPHQDTHTHRCTHKVTNDCMVEGH